MRISILIVSSHISLSLLISLGAGEEVEEIAGGASGMGVDRIVEAADRASEGQAAVVYGAATPL